MTRHQKHLLNAASAAELSPLEIKHGAVLVFGGKIIGRGFNSDRSRLGAANMVALHSEVKPSHRPPGSARWPSCLSVASGGTLASVIAMGLEPKPHRPLKAQRVFCVTGGGPP